MEREELLKLLKDKISPHYYTALIAWTAKRDKCFLGTKKRKFSLSPTHVGDGYFVYANAMDFISVYKD